MSLQISERAITKALELRKTSGTPDAALRVAIAPGGCSGLRYALTFDEAATTDTVLKFDTSGDVLAVLVDPMSSEYLQEASIDYVEDLNRVGFVVENPSAVRSCACGESFCS